jgi:tRNA threonylcarbamoyladenosine biosynthesis protein TsaB
MMILALETSGPKFSLALLEGDKVIKSVRASSDLLHETALADEIKHLLSSQDMEVHQLSAIAAGSGPGSYSGLRIGMALASGFSFASGIPFFAAGTLENLFYQMKQMNPEADFFLSLMPARKKEFYLGLWRKDTLTPVISPQWTTEDGIPGMLAEISKSDCLVCNLEIHPFPTCSENVIYCHVEPDAITVGRIAHQKINSVREVHGAAIEPDYLKPVYISGTK